MSAVHAQSPTRQLIGDFVSRKLAMIGLLIVLILVVTALLAPVLAPQDPYDLMQLDIMDGRLAPPVQPVPMEPSPIGWALTIRDAICSVQSCTACVPVYWSAFPVP